MVPTVTPATWQHAAELAQTMRAGDVAECVAFGYSDALDALVTAVAFSTEAWTVRFDDEIAAMLGVTEAHGGAILWCLTGEVVERAKLTFMRSSHRLVNALLTKYRRLANLVDARYQRAIDWIECLGFTVGAVVAHPETGAPCRLFQREA